MFKKCVSVLCVALIAAASFVLPVHAQEGSVSAVSYTHLEVILRHNTNILLDDITLDDISNQLQIPIKTVMNDGQHLLHAVLGE